MDHLRATNISGLFVNNDHRIATHLKVMKGGRALFIFMSNKNQKHYVFEWKF